MPSGRDVWLRERKRILEQLREREPALVRELEACDAALDKLGDDTEPPSDEFVKYAFLWQAIVAYLEKRGRTEEEGTIIQGVLDGGWKRGNPRAATDIKNSVRYHVRTSKTTKVLKKFPSGRVGLYGWSPDYDRR